MSSKRSTIWKRNADTGRLEKAGHTRYPSAGQYLYHHTATRMVDGKLQRLTQVPAVKVVGEDGTVAYNPKPYVHRSY